MPETFNEYLIKHLSETTPDTVTTTKKRRTLKDHTFKVDKSMFEVIRTFFLVKKADYDYMYETVGKELTKAKREVSKYTKIINSDEHAKLAQLIEEVGLSFIKGKFNKGVQCKKDIEEQSRVKPFYDTLDATCTEIITIDDERINKFITHLLTQYYQEICDSGIKSKIQPNLEAIAMFDKVKEYNKCLINCKVTY